MKLIKKSSRGDTRRSLEHSKAKLKSLEHDYGWRRIKAGYVAIATIVAILIGSGVYGNSASSSFTGQGSISDGLWAMFAAVLAAWFVYRFFLPRLYVYLNPPKATGKHPSQDDNVQRRPKA
jgi:hypothetical protein